MQEQKWFHLEMINRVHQLGIHIISSACICRLRVHDI